MMTHLHGVTIAMHGTRPLYDRKNLSPLLAILEKNKLAPTKFGFDERGGDPYTHEGALALLEEPPVAFVQTHLILRRVGAGKYFAMIALWNDAYVSFDFDAKQSTAMWPRVFAIADAIAELFEPDWGAAALEIDSRADRTQPFANDDERDMYLMTSGSELRPGDFHPHGPHGLAMRTYVGPYFAEQLGRERIETLPLVVEKLGWGGYRIDLVPEPWTADAGSLVAAWRRGMAHLQDAKVFAVPDMAPTFAMHWRRGANAKLRE